MVRRITGRSWFIAIAAVAAIAFSAPAFAQGTIRGVVTDDKGQPVDGAKVTIEGIGGSSRKYETKTNRKGEFTQMGLATQQWSVMAEKEKLASEPKAVATSANTTQVANLVLNTAAVASAEEVKAKNEELKKVFEEGVVLSNAGQHLQAVEKFNAGIVLNEACFDCYNNIGYSYAQLKDWDKAEAAYKKSIEIKADDSAAYNGLATVYNAQKKFDLAAEAGASAAKYAAAGGGGAGNADALYNQAVILFNQSKPAEALPLLEQAVAANPNHADAQYLLGMCLISSPDPSKAVPAMEAYLKLAPSGPADKVNMANTVISTFKK